MSCMIRRATCSYTCSMWRGPRERAMSGAERIGFLIGPMMAFWSGLYAKYRGGGGRLDRRRHETASFLQQSAGFCGWAMIRVDTGGMQRDTTASFQPLAPLARVKLRSLA